MAIKIQWVIKIDPNIFWLHFPIVCFKIIIDWWWSRGERIKKCINHFVPLHFLLIELKIISWVPLTDGSCFVALPPGAFSSSFIKIFSNILLWDWCLSVSWWWPLLTMKCRHPQFTSSYQSWKRSIYKMLWRRAPHSPHASKAITIVNVNLVDFNVVLETSMVNSFVISNQHEILSTTT